MAFGPISQAVRFETRERMKAGLRELLLRGLTGLGVLLGLVWGLNNPPAPTKPPTCTTANCVGDVVNHSLMSGFLAVMGPTVIGAAIGFTLAFALSFALLRPVRQSGGA